LAVAGPLIEPTDAKSAVTVAVIALITSPPKNDKSDQDDEDGSSDDEVPSGSGVEVEYVHSSGGLHVSASSIISMNATFAATSLCRLRRIGKIVRSIDDSVVATVVCHSSSIGLWMIAFM
jgi:hypothetical protein